VSKIALEIVPDPDDDQCAMVQAIGFVNGLETRFMVDSGAARTQVVNSPGLHFGEAVATHSSNGVFGASTRSVHRLDHLVVGDLTWQQIDVVVEEPGEHIMPLLGMDLLGQYSLTFDFARAELHLDERVIAEATFPIWRGAGGHLYVEAQLGDTVAHCVWDSGAGMTVVDETFWRANQDHFSELGTSEGIDATGATQNTGLYELRGLRLADRDFAPHHVAVVDLSHVNATLERPMNFILGFPTLRQATWWFDVEQNRWALGEND